MADSILRKRLEALREMIAENQKKIEALRGKPNSTGIISDYEFLIALDKREIVLIEIALNPVIIGEQAEIEKHRAARN